MAGYLALMITVLLDCFNHFHHKLAAFLYKRIRQQG